MPIEYIENNDQHFPTGWLPIEIRKPLDDNTLYTALCDALHATPPIIRPATPAEENLVWWRKNYGILAQWMTTQALGSSWTETKDSSYCQSPWQPFPQRKGPQGTLTKRLQQLAKALHGKYLPQSVVAAFGTQIQRELGGPATKYHIAFSRDFSWQAGTYGDGSSCYYGGRSGARRLLRENGVVALHAFRAHQPGSASRSLVAPFLASERLPIDEHRGDGFSLFNAYGPMQLFEQAKVFQEFVGKLKYPVCDNVALSNRGVNDHTEVLYTNQGRCYYVGVVRPSVRLLLNIDDSNVCPTCGVLATDCPCPLKCYHCRRGLPEDTRARWWHTQSEQNADGHWEMLSMLCGPCSRRPTPVLAPVRHLSCTHCGYLTRCGDGLVVVMIGRDSQHVSICLQCLPSIVAYGINTYRIPRQAAQYRICTAYADFAMLEDGRNLTDCLAPDILNRLVETNQCCGSLPHPRLTWLPSATAAE